MSNDKSRDEFEAWHRANGNNTQGIKWVDDLLLAAWQASQEVALNEAAEACEELKSAYQNISESTLLTVSGKTVHQGMFGGAHNCAVAIRNLK
jgi:hypothetical protein